jgi:branched-chain amino acid transport system substrate-binding protein
MTVTLTEPSGELEAASTRVAPQEVASPSLTRGFLFADLRGYTRFVETHGATAAAELLVRYRAIVREAVARHQGAEIKTEGDSFYVVFPSVSAAVQCGLAIVAGARASEPPINVGVGVHAGETVDTPDGFVGSAVNVAARICAIAGPGQVLVSDTVRAITQTVLQVTFAPLGRRQLKGVHDPLMLYAVVPHDPAEIGRADARRRRALALRGAAVVIAVALLGGAVAWWRSRPAAGLPAGDWTIAVHVPLSGDDADDGKAIVDAVQLAVDDTNASGALAPAHLVVDARDEGAMDSQAATTTAVEAWASDPRVVGIVGPAGSAHARSDIPISNQAGLLMCSPLASDAALTKPALGAVELRRASPDRIGFVRLAARDDLEAPAAAFYLFNDLQVRAVVAVDDASAPSRDRADAFAKSFDALQPFIAAAGRSSFRRTLNPGATDFAAVYAPVFEEGTNPGSLGRPGGGIYYAGDPESGIADLKRVLAAALSETQTVQFPLIGWHALLDGSGADDASYIHGAGPAADRSYATALSIATATADFDARYRAKFGRPPHPYDGAAYACTEVIVAALREAVARALDVTQLRDWVRAYVTDTSHSFDTVLGSVRFDANGDATNQYVSLYKVDVRALGGRGDWVAVKQQDFGPAP